ncbi:hypothetical protein JZ751_007523, partial [Albula glossodonta]
EGMRQHFELGQVLKKRYQGFLNETYNRHEIWVRSTDYDRTLMSAEANLAGMYPPDGSQVFNPSLDWQPIPVHTVPQSEEQLLSFPQPSCPRYEKLMNESRQTEAFLNMTRTYKAQHNLTAPDWVTPEVMTNLRKLKNFSFQLMFGVYKREEKCRLQGGILLHQIVKNISASAVPNHKKPLKMVVYSAHDTTMVALQSALNVFNGKQPPYAACHMFELFQEDNGSFSVAMFYRNDSSKEPYPLALPGCAQYCPLQEFISLINPVIPVNREQECQITAERKDTEQARAFLSLSWSC